MFEEYITETWICPQCGEVSKVRVEEYIKRNFERNSLDMFEFSGGVHSEMKVFCFVCNSECYRE